MSMTPQGPGWWQASDGRWYPPHTRQGAAQHGGQHGGQQPYGQQYGGHAPYGQPVKGGPVPGFGGPARPPVPPRKSGVPKVLIILAVVVLALGVGGYVAVSWVMGKVTDNVIGGDCRLVSADDVNSAMNGQFDLIQLGGLTSIATPVLDSRVIADGTTCWATETGDSATPRLVRIAKLDSGDAAARFQQEKTLAQGVSQDQGGGITVSTSAYFNRDVDGFGDEAFCTTTDMTGASGVLVRRGGTLVYVSLTSGTFSTDLTPGDDGSIKSADDDTHCDVAQRIAEKVG